MKLLFLDIDGVLNSYRTDLAYGRARTLMNIDPVSLKLMQKVVKETDCTICLISEWRKHWDFMDLGKKLDLPILFETDDHKDEKTRGEQVQSIIDGLNPDKYVVVDDNQNDFEFDDMPFVNVEEESGFSYKDYLLCLEYLK